MGEFLRARSLRHFLRNRSCELFEYSNPELKKISCVNMSVALQWHTTFVDFKFQQDFGIWLIRQKCRRKWLLAGAFSNLNRQLSKLAYRCRLNLKNSDNNNLRRLCFLNPLWQGYKLRSNIPYGGRDTTLRLDQKKTSTRFTACITGLSCSRVRERYPPDKSLPGW